MGGARQTLGRDGGMIFGSFWRIAAAAVRRAPSRCRIRSDRSAPHWSSTPRPAIVPALTALRGRTRFSAALGLLTETHEPSQTADLRDLPSTAVNEVILRAGYRARLLVPLVRSGEVVGALVVRRKAPGEFPANTVELLKTFAAQSVLAIRMRACSRRSRTRAGSWPKRNACNGIRSDSLGIIRNSA
jgi:GAF domain-containing protein